MKKYIYILLTVLTATGLFMACSNDTVTHYEGEQFFSFGYTEIGSLRLSESNTSAELVFGFVHPADKDYTFDVKISENGLGDLVSVNGQSEGTFSVTIPKGQTTSSIKLVSKYKEIEEGAFEGLGLEIEDPKLDMPMFISPIEMVIFKPCTFDPAKIKEWEGIYQETEGEVKYKMEVRYIGDNIFTISNYLDINHRVVDPQLVKIVLDYSVTDRYSLLVVPGYFYTSAVNGNKIGIESKAPNVATLYGDLDVCSKSMYVPSYQVVPGVGYVQGSSSMKKIGELPEE